MPKGSELKRSFDSDISTRAESMRYVYACPSSASFTGKGLIGYCFGPLKHKGLEVYYIQVHKGHDTFMVSSKITRIYYVLSGTGYFIISKLRYDVGPGQLVEVPPGVEYSYSGTMTLIAVSQPRWFGGNDKFTRWNPDVVAREYPPSTGAGWAVRLVRARIFGKSPTNLYLRVNQSFWKHLPSSVATSRPARVYAGLLNRLARTHHVRAQAVSTFFFRNRAALELVRRLVATKGKGEAIRVAVLGCSTGAEAYSVASVIRDTRTDLRLSLDAVDISKEVVEFARQGEYSVSKAELNNTSICERMTEAEIDRIFERQGDKFIVKPWLREGMNWHVHDVGDDDLADALGTKDLVIANNFLCHMDPPEAERCLRNISRLVAPGGFLWVSGIDLDVRAKVANALGWMPFEDLLEEIHEGDPSLRNDWPCHYAGLEPLDKRRKDWRIRYAAVFQIKPNPDRDFAAPAKDKRFSSDPVAREVAL
jgi:chemotaxis methyl-accepting protein methylase